MMWLAANPNPRKRKGGGNMTLTTKEAEGKYYWTANLKPYLGRDQLHQSKGLAEIYWSGNGI
jgi:hypothetical protein